MLTVIVVAGAVVVALVLLIISVQVVRPVEVRLVERFGRYTRTMDQGLHFIIPFIEEVLSIEMTETMVDVEPQVVITKDKLNVIVDAIVYYRVKDAKSAAYNVNDFEGQLVSLSRTTLRSVIGQMTLTEANEKRADINSKIEAILDKETSDYGVDVLRVEIQKIEPPKDVVESMNMVVKAEQKKIAAKELALANEIEADGFRMAAIKKAEGEKQARILDAQGTAQARELVASAEAKAIEMVSASAAKNFTENAQTLKKLEVAQACLQHNTKLVLPEGSSLVNLISDFAGLVGK